MGQVTGRILNSEFRIQLPIILAATLLLGSPLIGQDPAPEPPRHAKALDSITPAELREQLEYLASDELEGRNAGYAGNDKAAEAIAAHFKACGLKPVGDEGTFFQNFVFEVRVFDPRERKGPAKKAKTRNVVGLLEGSDPALKKEAVVIGAHYDHVGREGQSNAGRSPKRHNDPDVVWNGADDNGSGTVALLELAEAFKEGGLAPKRSVLFIAFSAEEHGLYGSYWYCDHPLVPLDRTTLAINLDMIGRNDERPVLTHGVATAKGGELRRIVEDAAAQVRLGADLHGWGDIKKDDSDHYPFFAKKVPVMFFFTDFHADYHAVGDTADKIAYPHLASIARATLLIAMEAATRKERLVWNPPRSLGISGEAGPGGFRVDQVTAKSAAAEAGVKRGDVVVELNGTAIGGDDPQGSLERAIEEAPEGKAVGLIVLRSGKKVELKVMWK